MYQPLELSRFIRFEKDREIYLFLITHENKPGVLAKETKLLADSNVNIVNIVVSSPTLEAREVTTTLLLDFSNSERSPKDIAEGLTSLEEVKSVDFVEPQLPMVIFDTYHFPLTLAGERAIVWGESWLKGLLEGIKRAFGEVGETVLYHTGYETGKKVAESYKDNFEVNLRLSLGKLLALITQSMGWGVLRAVVWDVDERVFILRVRDLWECKLAGKSDKPNSQFYRGVLAGVFTSIFGREMVALETKCIAKGDEYCEFLIKSR